MSCNQDFMHSLLLQKLHRKLVVFEDIVAFAKRRTCLPAFGHTEITVEILLLNDPELAKVMAGFQLVIHLIVIIQLVVCCPRLISRPSSLAVEYGSILNHSSKHFSCLPADVLSSCFTNVL